MPTSPDGISPGSPVPPAGLPGSSLTGITWISPAGTSPSGTAAAGRSRSSGRDWVNHATAAPVTATGHSTTPATPRTPAPVYTARRRPRGDTAPTLSSAPPATLLTVPAPGTRRSTDAAVRNGCGRVVDDDCCRAMIRLFP
ncbi:hypothetical protein ABZT17_12780 [Streptomyces sp. NPDC005648]|uniref:hypothetical protein n=1 Tax=Streptomyces sp. NPDC005648 TaxID=3157044 RepID=UPI0033B4991A